MQDEAAMSFRLSPQQELLWSSNPDGPVGGPFATIGLGGDVGVGRLREALLRIVERHEILRTTFPRRSGMNVPLQVVQESSIPDFEEVDLSALSAAEQDAHLVRLEQDARTRVWDYDSGPLVRAQLATISPVEHVLLLAVAPPCADVGSLATMAAELAAHYGGGPTADDPLQYADFAEWQHQLGDADDDEAEAGRRFWSESIQGPPQPIPFVNAATASASDAVEVPLGTAELDAIAAVAARHGVPQDAVVQAAWQIVAARLAAADAVVAFVPAERGHAELRTAVGAFARSRPLQVRLSDGVSFADVVAQIGRAREVAERWQDYAPAEAPATTAFLTIEPFAEITAAGVVFSCRRLEPASSFPLAAEWDGTCRVRFLTGAVDRLTAERTAAYLRNVLTAAVIAPDAPVETLELLGSDDVRRLTVDVNDTAAPVDARSIHDLIAAAAAARPAQAAVVDEHGSITYEELITRANQVAHKLLQIGIEAGSVVGLCTDRSVDMIVGVLGILKAGGAYLPLNFEHPPARLAHQLSETGAPAIVTQEGFLSKLPAFDGSLVCLDRDAAELAALPVAVPDTAVGNGSTAYVIYTSGSTGTPKGVAVTHANVVNYVSAMAEKLGANDVPLAFGMVTAISTDLGNTAVFPALCTGGTLVLVSPGAAADAAAAAAFLRRHPVDVLKITPSHLNALLSGSEGADVLPKRWLVVGGEALSWDIVAHVRELGSCRILNHYGPTETTIGSTTSVVADGPGPYAPATAPIGRPIANAACYVLDERGRCVPEGVLGELHIGGAGVATGYVGQPELTAERFHPDPFAGGTARMYATGDLVRRLPDGEIEFAGRKDDQLKIRGFRVEPSEVEAALRSYEPVREAVVVGADDGRGERRLVAYVVADRAVTADELKRHAAQWLPEVMIPSAFATLDSLPLTSSGKVDRLALPAVDALNGSATVPTYVAPRTPIEEAIAAIWANVLGIERVGSHDDFFALGGHSLLATQIIAQIRSDLSVNLPLHSLFTAPTVAMLAEQVVQLMGEDGETARLLAEVDQLSDEEVDRLLAGEGERPA